MRLLYGAYLPIGLVWSVVEDLRWRWRWFRARNVTAVVPFGDNGFLIVPPVPSWWERRRRGGAKVPDAFVDIGYLDESGDHE